MQLLKTSQLLPSAGVTFNEQPINKPKKCMWLLIALKLGQRYTGSREAVHRLTVL